MEQADDEEAAEVEVEVQVVEDMATVIETMVGEATTRPSTCKTTPKCVQPSFKQCNNSHHRRTMM